MLEEKSMSNLKLLCSKWRKFGFLGRGNDSELLREDGKRKR